MDLIQVTPHTNTIKTVEKNRILQKKRQIFAKCSCIWHFPIKIDVFFYIYLYFLGWHSIQGIVRSNEPVCSHLKRTTIQKNTWKLKKLRIFVDFLVEMRCGAPIFAYIVFQMAWTDAEWQNTSTQYSDLFKKPDYRFILHQKIE